MRAEQLCWIALSIILAQSAAQAACFVNDPTGTPLNVRARPNGPILGALYNGGRVRRLTSVYDDRGRPWTLIQPLDGGKSGWVFRQFVLCD